jgi:cold shock CspA family protein/peroxiredoxin
MNPDIRVGGRLPDFTLPNHRGQPVRLSSLAAPTADDQMLGFNDGYPLILIFYRGFYCPRDGMQFRLLVQFQEELSVNYCRLAAVSADPPRVSAAYRSGLGASWPMLCDTERAVIDRLGIRDETEEEYPGCALPTTFVLEPDLTIYKVYGGWYFLARPTVEELRHDLRELMSRRSNYAYAAYNRPEIIGSVRIPAEVWMNGAPPLGASGNPVARGVVQFFDLDEGNGIIQADDGTRVYLHFSGIPGDGYRTVRAGSEVEFEVVTGPIGQPCAINLRVLRPARRWGPGALPAALPPGLFS